MTDYDDKENSIDDGSPYELYWWKGTYRSYYYTTDSVEHSYLGNTYVPIAGLSRSDIKAGTHEEDNVDLTVKLPITDQLVKDYAFQTTPPALELVIFRFHRGATTAVDYWKGKVASMVTADNVTTVRVPSKFGSVLQGNIPSAYAQPPCNHILFGELCGVSRVLNSVDTTVVSVVDRTIVVASVGAFPDGYFVGGEIVQPERNERRMIIAQAGTSLTVNYQFGRLLPEENVQVAAGCDHSRGPNGCAKYSNLPRFGGDPYVPGESNNLFTQGIG